jgi:hypothetical protein
MFATLLGPLPRPPLPDDARPEALLDAVLDVQLEHGLGLVTDAGWPAAPGDPVASWRAASRRTAGIVKAVIDGPYSGGVGLGGSVEPWRSSIADLADAGCPLVEIAEPAAVRIGEAAAERERFLDLHERLLSGLHDRSGLHLSLSITGGSADTAGAATILGPAYASLAVDLIDGPDNWRLVRAAPRELGIVCGALSPRPGSDDGPETLLWAAAYAASSAGRGPDRVGLATASSLAGLSWASAVRKIARLGEALRIAGLPPEDRLGAIDPRAIDSRSAALGRYEPGRARRRPD